MDVLSYITENWSTVVLVLSLITLLVFWRSRNAANHPPGPTGWPIIGSLLDFSGAVDKGRLTEYLEGLHKKYGPIVSFKAGVQRMIFIEDGKMMAELFQSRNLALRPYETLAAAKIMSDGSPLGLLFGNGPPHEEMRRFSLLTLRDFGVGKHTIDSIIQTEAGILCDHFGDVEKSNGVVHDIRMKLHSASANAIHHIIFGFRHEQDNPDWMRLMRDLDQLDDINPFAFAGNYFPILEKFPALCRYLSDNLDERFTTLNTSAVTYLKDQIEKHKSTYVEGDIRDFIDLYIQLQSEDKEHYTPENVFAVMLDLFKAGTSTVAVTLTWAMVYLVKQPETQRALREEIDKVIGHEEFNRHDQDKLIKMRAFVHEVNRFSSIIPVTAPHTPSKPLLINGYSMSPGDIVFGNLYAIQNDKTYWKDPENFRYERWINDQGELIKHDGHYYPFSVGKRGCPGKQFASIQMLLILVHFLQNYTFEEAESCDEQFAMMDGLLRIPNEYPFKVSKRKTAA